MKTKRTATIRRPCTPSEAAEVVATSATETLCITNVILTLTDCVNDCSKRRACPYDHLTTVPVGIRLKQCQEVHERCSGKL